jgi:glycosyltransferase involved in cell wall biosynthesis
MWQEDNVVLREPRISVIISCFNYEKYIARAIESVIHQDYANKEIIVVDDGSSDGSAEIIRSYGHCATLAFEENRGQAVACLKAARLATGDYIQFLDADDYLAEGALARIAAACRPEVSKVQFPLTPVRADEAVIGRPFPEMGVHTSADLIQEINRRGCYTTPPNSGNVYRADVLPLIREISYERSVDGVIFLLAPFVGEVVMLTEPQGFYRFHSQNHSQHGVLSARRFHDEGARFMDRLDHLSAILSDIGDSRFRKRTEADYAFVCSREILRQISDGHRPALRLIWAHWAGLLRERADLRSLILFGGWATASWVAPDRLRRGLALYLTDPQFRRWLHRRLLKRDGAWVP